MFEKASRKKLRFKVDRGILMVEDLWDLSLAQLNKMAKALNAELKAAEEEDFLAEASSKDVTVKLRFDIVLHVLNTKKEEADKKKNAAKAKAEKDRLLSLLERKQNEADEALSPEEIKKRIEALS